MAKEKSAVEAAVSEVEDAAEEALKGLGGREYLEACEDLAAHFEAKADAYREETGDDD